LIDAFHRAPTANPRSLFVARVLVGASLLATVLALPSLALGVAYGDVPDSVVVCAYVLCVAVQLVAIRIGAPLPVLAWTLLLTLGGFLTVASLTTRELEHGEPFWLALIPLAARVLAGPGSDDLGQAVPTPAPGATTLLAIALGIVIVAAHQLGLTFDQPPALTPRWGVGIDFTLFMVASFGLLFLYDAAVRESQTELGRLRRLLSVCAWCKRIRDDDEAWVPLERYVAAHERRDLSHGICPTCAAAVWPETDGPPPG
jgi:hypothetical protein